jgi:two-component system, chemotaxis family, chemotaxis protein CheY
VHCTIPYTSVRRVYPSAVAHPNLLMSYPLRSEVHGSSALTQVRRMKLLIIEDSPLVRRMYGLAFSRRDHDLVEAENGLEALDALAGAADPFDVILLDLRMPDMDGVTFLRTVRRTALFRDIPIIVTTSEPESSELLQEVRALGIDAVVKKPWKPRELLEVVHSVRAAHPRHPP